MKNKERSLAIISGVVLTGSALWALDKNLQMKEGEMKTYPVSASAIIPASPKDVYTLLADYEKHATILPPKYFKKIEVTTGGVGAGTEIDVDMEVLGQKVSLHMHVTEPEPGRVLQEEDRQQELVTTFTCDPHNDGKETHLIITTIYPQKPGIAGVIEKWINPPIARGIYNEELGLIQDAFASSE